MDRIATKFHNNWVSGCHFVAKISKSLLISATAVNLDQGHRKDIQYISPDLHFPGPKYLELNINNLDVEYKLKT